MVDLPAVAFVAPVAALAGVAVGPFITGRAEERRWMRQQRADASAELLSALAALGLPYQASADTGSVVERVAAAELARDVFALYFQGPLVDLARSAVHATTAREVLSLDRPEQYEELSNRAEVTTKALIAALRQEFLGRRVFRWPWLTRARARVMRTSPAPTGRSRPRRTTTR